MKNDSTQTVQRNSKSLESSRGRRSFAIATITVTALIGLVWFVFHDQPIAISPEPPPVVMTERRLQNGVLCKASMNATSPKWESLSILVGDKALKLPTEAFEDLPAFEYPLTTAFAEAAEEIYFLVAGGKDESAWTAKLTIHDGQIVERELTVAGKEPVNRRFADPHQDITDLKPLIRSEPVIVVKEANIKIAQP